MCVSDVRWNNIGLRTLHTKMDPLPQFFKGSTFLKEHYNTNKMVSIIQLNNTGK